MNYKKLDLENWKRKKQYNFFKSFSEPFFGLCFDIDITKLYDQCKDRGDSLFVGYLYHILRAANLVEEMKYRIKGDDVVIFDDIDISPTVAREDETFGFSYMDFYEDYDVFKENANKEIERVRSGNDLDAAADKIDTIHFSTIPWIKFTSVSHARSFEGNDSVPKIACGKVFKENSRVLMPLSIHVHHALMDGYHIGQFESHLREGLESL